MQVSVIIPVYNAENYIRKSVESALSQRETGEVILVEDASLDKSLKVCQELVREYPLVKLFRHKDGKNHGASASRNLGIEKANFDYIAFLDADDFYLPERFKVASEQLDLHSHVDGVYEAIGTFFQDKNSQEKWNSVGRSGQELTTVTVKVEPKLLFETMIDKNNCGWFHANGLVVRKKIFERTGYFDKHLEFSEDIVMWFKMAAVGNLISGRLDTPVAMRRVHSNNHITKFHEKLAYYNGLPRWKTIFDWGYKNGLDSKKLTLLFMRYVDCFNTTKLKTISNPLIKKIDRRKIGRIGTIIFLVIQYPKMLLQRELWSFSRNWVYK